MIKTILTNLTLVAALAIHASALTTDDFKLTSLSGSGKTLELSIEATKSARIPDRLGP